MFNQYPYLNLNDFNLDYILKAIKEMRYEVTNFVSINAIKYADPIQWNITSQYEKNTIVIDPVTGTAYISVAPVPAGVALTRPEYWTVVFDLGSFVTRAAQNFTRNWESETTTTATFSTPAGGWLVWGDVLYKALVNITAGDAYVVDSNIKHITIEDVISAIVQGIADEVQARQDADAALSDRIDDEVQARKDADGDLNNLSTNDKSNLVAAINEVNSTGGGAIAKIGDLDSLVTDDKSNLVNSINEVVNVNIGYLTRAISEESNARRAEDNLLKELIPNLHWIFIGDSYNAGANPDGPAFNPYGNRIISKLGLTESYSAGRDGAAFTPTGYLQILQGLENVVTNPEHITDIMVCGGYNDRILSASDITTGISNFVSYCKTQYPNARVHIGCIGKHKGSTTIETEIHNISLMSFMKCVDYGATYIQNSDLCLHTYNNFTSDGIHPNDAGQEEIANALCNYVTGGAISKHGVALPFTVSGSSQGTASGGGYMEMDNNMISIEFTSLSLALSTPTTITCSGSTIIDMGVVSGAYITSSLAYFTAVNAALTIHNGTDYQTVAGSLKIGIDNHLYFTPVDTNGAGFTSIVNATNVESYNKPISMNLNATII